MASELAQLRSTLQELQSYELPANCRLDEENNDPNNNNAAGGNNADDGDDNAGHLIYDPKLLQRYKSARNAYIQQATIDKFLSSLAQYDAVTNTLPLPDVTDEQRQSEKEALQKRQAEISNEVKNTIAEVSGGIDVVRTKWNQFCDKREELSQIVEGMERSERKRRLEEGDDTTTAAADDDNNIEMAEEEGQDDDNDEEITEEDVAIQEEKLDELRQRKLALENRLRNVRAQILDVEDDCHRTKRAVNEVRVKGGRKPLDWLGLSSNNKDNNDGEANDDGSKEKNKDDNSENVEYISVVAEEVDAEIAEMQEKVAGYKKSAEFYDGIRELMEELGGVKILSSKSILPPATAVPLGENPTKKQKQEEEGIVLNLMLLGSHILEITLTKKKSQGNDKKGDLHVTNAKLTTQTTFPMLDASQTANNDDNEETKSLMETIHSISLSHQSFSKIMSQKPSVEVTIPPLDDLVSWSQSIEGQDSSSRAIKFVIVETLARIRTLDARVVELTALRENYAATCYDVESTPENENYGGAEQEVVCAIPEGITAALRLGADCPLMPGSVYVSEIFGIGGWNEETLEELKRIVGERRCRGPVEVMECMVEEIGKRNGEAGWSVPGTPSLPR